MPAFWDSSTALWDDAGAAWDSGIEGAIPTHLVWVYDYTGAQSMVLDLFLDLWTDDRLQDSETLGFTIPATSPKAVFVLVDGMVRYRGRFYRVTSKVPTRDGTTAVYNVEAEALWTDLAGYPRPGAFTLVDTGLKTGAAAILDGTGWTVDNTASKVTSDPYAIDMADKSTLELLRAWAAITSTELVFDTARRTVALVAQQGTTQPLGFRYGLNLKGVRRIETPPTATRLYAYGRSGLTIAGVTGGAEYIDDFSFYTGQGLTLEQAEAQFTRGQIWADDSFVTDQALYDAALIRLAGLSQPTIAYEATVADLSAATDAPVGRYNLGDTVPVRDDPLGIDVAVRVVRLVRRPLQPAETAIELAYLQGPKNTTSTSARTTSTGQDWLLFLGSTNADRQLDASLALLSDRGLQFASGGQAILFADVTGVATGAGTVYLQLYDETRNQAMSPVAAFAMTTGDPNLHATITVAHQNLQGNYLFSVRAQFVAAGSSYVSIPSGNVRFSILAQGAVGVTLPPNPTSTTFVYNGAGGTTGTAQDFTVPPDVTSVTIDAYGAQGGSSPTENTGGKGAHFRATIPVTAGETLHVLVGGNPATSGTGGYNGGGAGYRGGGGASDVRRTPYATADRLVVAGGGGGGANDVTTGDFPSSGGGGGYPAGFPGGESTGFDDINPTLYGGKGGTQTVGGSAGDDLGGVTPATAGTLGQGGAGAISGGNAGGGGGGGLYGGGGGGWYSGERSADGGGGSSGAPAAGATEVFAENVARVGHGLVIISWNGPIT